MSGPFRPGNTGGERKSLRIAEDDSEESEEREESEEGEESEKGEESKAVRGSVDPIRGHPRGHFSARLPTLEPKKPLSAEDVGACHALMAEDFGAGIAGSAFSIVARRQAAGRKIRGEHVQFAFAAARDMVAPKRSLSALQKALALELPLAQDALDKSQKTLGFLNKVLHERSENAASGLDARGDYVIGSMKPGLSQDVRNTTAERDKAEIAFNEASAHLQEVSDSMEHVSNALETCTRALPYHFKPGEDSLTLERDVEAMAPGGAIPQRGGSTSRSDKSWKIHTEASAESQDNLSRAHEKLAAMQEGPPLRRMQGLLDNLGDDPRLADALNDRGAHKNFLQRACKTMSSPKGIAGVVAKLIPGLNIGVALGLAIRKEDQERKLRGGVQALQQWTRVAAMAQILADSKESEKKVQGAVAAGGFLMTGPALPIPAVSGVGILAAHAGIQVIAHAGAAVASATGSHAAGQALSVGGTIATGRAVGTMASKTTATGVGAAVQPVLDLEATPSSAIHSRRRRRYVHADRAAGSAGSARISRSGM